MTRDEKIELIRKLGADTDVSRMTATILASNNVFKVADLPDAEIDLLIELAEAMDQQLGGGTWVPGGERGQ